MGCFVFMNWLIGAFDFLNPFNGFPLVYVFQWKVTLILTLRKTVNSLSIV